MRDFGGQAAPGWLSIDIQDLPGRCERFGTFPGCRPGAFPLPLRLDHLILMLPPRMPPAHDRPVQPFDSPPRQPHRRGDDPPQQRQHRLYDAPDGPEHQLAELPGKERHDKQHEHLKISSGKSAVSKFSRSSRIPASQSAMAEPVICRRFFPARQCTYPV